MRTIIHITGSDDWGVKQPWQKGMNLYWVNYTQNGWLEGGGGAHTVGKNKF